MIEPIKMAPCPFCEGPPCIIAQDLFTKAEVFEDHRCDPDPDSEEWPDFQAHIWCHDCGARGPNIDTITLGTFFHQYDLEVADVMRIAVERWNDRHNKARSCYDSGEKRGLNIWPRADA